MTGQVSWLTDSFRWLERAGRSVWVDPVGSLQDVGQSVADAAKKTTRETSARVDQFRKTDAEALKPQPGIAWSAPAYDLSGRVVRVSDGDTLTILDAENRQHKIRLYGIDTPESGQPFGRAARRALSDRVSGKGIGIDIKDTDSYGRTVGVVYLGAEDINLDMVRSGYAWWYKKYAPFSDELRDAEQRARAERLGLWSDLAAIPPWEWRRRRR
jgi:endonuclease YncB( thermonuclease family)